MASTSSSLMESLFQRSLDDLIKCLRLHHTSSSTSLFISKNLDEIRRELKSIDLSTKSTALQKLTYLHSLHSLDISFSSIELSSSPSFPIKRLAYLSASLSLPPDSPLFLLLTHQLRKDLNFPNPHEASLAFHCLSSLATSDLACDLTPEIFQLLNSGKLIVRRKAISTLIRFFKEYSDSVRVCFKRLVESLETGDVGVLSAVVGVFCEMVSVEGERRAYLPLAPEFYRILVESRCNWVLIKVLKIFGRLVPLEGRLGRKVVETERRWEGGWEGR